MTPSTTNPPPRRRASKPAASRRPRGRSSNQSPAALSRPPPPPPRTRCLRSQQRRRRWPTAENASRSRRAVPAIHRPTMARVAIDARPRHRSYCACSRAAPKRDRISGAVEGPWQSGEAPWRGPCSDCHRRARWRPSPSRRRRRRPSFPSSSAPPLSAARCSPRPTRRRRANSASTACAAPPARTGCRSSSPSCRSARARTRTCTPLRPSWPHASRGSADAATKRAGAPTRSVSPGAGRSGRAAPKTTSARASPRGCAAASRASGTRARAAARRSGGPRPSRWGR
mmetsp:Transcript_269/g.967  ORF Transcript_269/g.967 Transcript_269/m.967 type:complete len:285 (-) Transcript_269:946-1800(-)